MAFLIFSSSGIWGGIARDEYDSESEGSKEPSAYFILSFFREK